MFVIRLWNVRTFLTAAMVITAFCARVDAAEWGDAEKYLAGLKQADSIYELPSYIEIPAPWAEKMKEMASLTAQNQVEYSACLNVDTKTQTWVAGAATKGQKTTTGLEPASKDCDENNVADVHTHPVGSPGPSEMDVAHTIAGRNLTSSFVVLNNKACAMVKGKGANYPLRRVRAIYGTNNVAWSILNERPQDGYHPLSVTAASLFQVEIALYCGETDGKLEKVWPETKLDLDNPLFVLMAKALTISMNIRTGQQKVPFDFTPTLDDAFKKSLESVSWLDEDQAYEVLGVRAPGELYRQLLEEAQLSASIGMSSDEAVIPDNRVDVPQAGFLSGCSKDNGATQCYVFEVYGTALSSKIVRTFAYFNATTNQRYVVERPNGGKAFKRREQWPGHYTYVGACVFTGTVCEIEGKGVITNQDGTEFEGTFKRGQPSGKGVAKFPDGERWAVRAVDGGLEKLRRLK